MGKTKLKKQPDAVKQAAPSHLTRKEYDRELRRLQIELLQLEEWVRYTKEAPWYVIETDNKRSAHLNLLSQLLSLIPYKSVPQQHIELPPRQERSYKRPPKEMQGTPVPVRYEVE